MLGLKLPRLLNINQVPKVFRERSILFGYRPPRSSAADCLFSVFQMTNETLNIWTHFLPAWYFLWKFLASFDALDAWSDRHAWPFLSYLATCVLYPLASSFAHTFSTMSVRTRHVCFFLDYGALALYSLGSAVAYSAYIFPEEWAGSTFHRNYVSFAVLNTILSTTLSCYSRFTETGQLKLSKAIRTFAFAYPYVYDSVPLSYRLYLCTVRGCSEEAISMHYMHTAFAWLTCFLFVTHLPERLAPGRFDFIGHSHQLFHICGIIGTYFQMEALLLDMTERREQLLPYMPAPNFAQTIGPVLASTVVSLIIIAAFSMTLYTMPKFSRRGSKRKRK